MKERRAAFAIRNAAESIDRNESVKVITDPRQMLAGVRDVVMQIWEIIERTRLLGPELER